MSLALQLTPSERRKERGREGGRERRREGGRKRKKGGERKKERREGGKEGNKRSVLLGILNAVITFSKCLFKIPMTLEFVLSQL